MDLTIDVVDDPTELMTLAQELLIKEIHHPIGTLPNIYDRILRKCSRRMILTVARLENEPVGVVSYRLDKRTAMFYVIPSQRRNGIASNLIAALRRHPDVGDRLIEGVGGDCGWESFFKANHIYCEQLVDPDTFVYPPHVTVVGSDAWCKEYRKNLTRARREFKRNYLAVKGSQGYEKSEHKKNGDVAGL